MARTIPCSGSSSAYISVSHDHQSLNTEISNLPPVSDVMSCLHGFLPSTLKALGLCNDIHDSSDQYKSLNQQLPFHQELNTELSKSEVMVEKNFTSQPEQSYNHEMHNYIPSSPSVASTSTCVALPLSTPSTSHQWSIPGTSNAEFFNMMSPYTESSIASSSSTFSYIQTDASKFNIQNDTIPLSIQNHITYTNSALPTNCLPSFTGTNSNVSIHPPNDYSLPSVTSIDTGLSNVKSEYSPDPQYSDDLVEDTLSYPYRLPSFNHKTTQESVPPTINIPWISTKHVPTDKPKTGTSPSIRSKLVQQPSVYDGPDIPRLMNNSRQRQRTKLFNDKFLELKKTLPIPLSVKISKIQVLRIARNYINVLKNVLKTNDNTTRKTDHEPSVNYNPAQSNSISPGVPRLNFSNMPSITKSFISSEEENRYLSHDINFQGNERVWRSIVTSTTEGSESGKKTYFQLQ